MCGNIIRRNYALYYTTQASNLCFLQTSVYCRLCKKWDRCRNKAWNAFQMLIFSETLGRFLQKPVFVCAYQRSAPFENNDYTLNSVAEHRQPSDKADSCVHTREQKLSLMLGSIQSAHFVATQPQESSMRPALLIPLRPRLFI